MVAALGDLDVGEVAGGGENARRQVVIKVRLRAAGVRLQAFAHRHDLRQFIGANQRVHFRKLIANLIAIALHHASRHDQLPRLAGFLVFGHLQNRVDGFLLGRIDEAAGVDHQDFGVARLRRQLVPALRQMAHHHLCIHEVLRASETYKTNFHG